MSFMYSYFGLTEGTGEQAVCCPFPHRLTNGTTYLENRPSAHVNTDTGLFNCKACGVGLNDFQFTQEITGQPETTHVSNITNAFLEAPTELEWEMSHELTEASHAKARSLGISDQVIKDLKLKSPTKQPEAIAFPVIMFGQIVDVRTYNPGGTPKIRSRKGATNGMIIPFDLWKDTTQMTLICAGEKDMAVARSHGFNAFTLTGGERALPKILNYFKGRRIVIVYDNDEAGIEGAKRLATCLYKYTQEIKVVTGFHEVCKEKGEDITDFFVKYKKTRKDLTAYIRETDLFVPEVTEEEDNSVYPLVDLYEASQKYPNKTVQSNIQVVAVSETAYRCPSLIIGTKNRLAEGADNTMLKGETVSWKLDNKNCGDILYLIDGTLKESQIAENVRRVLLKKPSERNLHPSTKKEITVYKLSVTDLYETADKDIQPMEYTAYSIGHKLESGKKYFITYKLVPHPYKGQQLVMIITNAEQASDSVSNFQLTEEVKYNLKKLQTTGATVKEKVHNIVQMMKSYIGYDGIDKLIEIMDLSFNTPLRFNFGKTKSIRGYLDTLIVGESRTGKSSTAEALRKLYGLGTFTSLAGNSATIAGLVGGSSKGPTGNMQTRAGVIPQNHGGLIIFEEFGKSSKDILRELTDIRSSNEVRIARVSGTTTLPAMVRMISLTNVKTTNEIKSIASYPNGISILTELVNTAEDIARYDIILVLSETGLQDIDPLWEPVPAFAPQVFRDRIRWVWTRTEEQIIKTPEIEKYIVEKCNALNKKYPSHIKLFGTEAWKKISRLAQAIAAYVVSASEDFENIIVTKECVDYAIELLVSIYDNNTFKFKEYVDMELRYRTTDAEAVASLQLIFNKYPGLVLQLEQSVEITKTMLESTTGLESQDIRKGLQLLTRSYFIKVDSTTIKPTERFRLTINRINRNTQIGRIGESSVSV